jgi:hypothetical protein
MASGLQVGLSTSFQVGNCASEIESVAKPE